MKEKNISEKSVFIPICQRCGDILKIDIEPFNFEVCYKCEKEDLSKRISIKNFCEKYIKDINSLKDELKNKKYLPKYLYEETEINYNNLLNYFDKNEICEKHNYNISGYCKECKKNICLFCIFENQDKNKAPIHNIIKYENIMPTNYMYNNIYKEIEKRETFINDFINKIDEWKKETYLLLNKSEELKNKLKDEITFIKSITKNYNKKFLNYTYITSFNNIYNYLINNNKEIGNSYFNNFENLKFNKDIYLFYNENNYVERTKYLYNIIDVNDKKENNKALKLNNISKINVSHNSIFLNDDYFVDIIEGKLNILYYLKKKLRIAAQFNLGENFNSYYISVSRFDNKIITWLNPQSIYVFNYNIDEKKILLTEKILIPNSKKCVEIKKDNLLVLTNNQFILWANKIKKKIKNYSEQIDNIIPVNDEYFITYNSNNKKIIFYEVDTLIEIKRLSNIENYKIFVSGNEYIIIIGYNKISLISLIFIKTKEIVLNYEIPIYNYNYIYCNTKYIYIIYSSTVYKLQILAYDDNDFKESIITLSNYFETNQIYEFLAHENF